MNYKTIPSLLILFIFFAAGKHATGQSTTNAGAIAKSDAGQNIVISSSIGQTFFSINEDANNKIVEGVQQPLRFQVLSVDDLTSAAQKVVLHPNPATTHFTLNFKEWNNTMDYKIISVTGKEVKTGKLLTNDASVHISDLSNGVYLLLLLDQNSNSRTIKFIKK